MAYICMIFTNVLYLKEKINYSDCIIYITVMRLCILLINFYKLFLTQSLYFWIQSIELCCFLHLNHVVFEKENVHAWRETTNMWNIMGRAANTEGYRKHGAPIVSL